MNIKHWLLKKIVESSLLTNEDVLYILRCLHGKGRFTLSTYSEEMDSDSHTEEY